MSSQITVVGHGDIAGFEKSFPDTSAGEAAAARVAEQARQAGHKVTVTIPSSMVGGGATDGGHGHGGLSC